MVRHCGLWRNHFLRHRSKCWECTFHMRWNCHYLECIHTYDPGSHNIQTRHIHLSCLLFHHLLSTFQRTHHFCNKRLCLSKTFHPTNHHMSWYHHMLAIVLCIPIPLYNHHRTGNNHIRTYHLDSDIRSHPTNHHICWYHRTPSIVLCIPISLHNHHQNGNNHTRTYHLDTDIRSHPNYHHSHSNHRMWTVVSVMTHCTLEKVWNLRN